MRQALALLKRLFSSTPRRGERELDKVRLRAKNGVVFEYDLKPPRDSIIRYPDGLILVIVRRKGYFLKGHIRHVYRGDWGELIYEGDIILFSSPFSKKPKLLKEV